MERVPSGLHSHVLGSTVAPAPKVTSMTEYEPRAYTREQYINQALAWNSRVGCSTLNLELSAPP